MDDEHWGKGLGKAIVALALMIFAWVLWFVLFDLIVRLCNG